MRPLIHWWLLASLVVMWGSSFLFIKIALRSFTPELLVAGRLLMAAIVLVAVLYASGRRLPTDRQQWVSFVLMAIVGNILPFWLISWGQQGIDSGLAGILMAVMPLTTVLLAHFFIEDEPLDRFRAAGFVLGFLGILVLTGPEALLQIRGEGTALLSELAVLSGAICYAVNTIITRRRPKSDSLVASAGVMLVASLLMVPIALWVDPIPTTGVTGEAIVALVFLGLVATALGTLAFFKLITLAGPGFMSLTNYLIPPWAVVVGFVVLKERPTASALAALVLILAGITLSERRRARSRRHEL